MTIFEILFWIWLIMSGVYVVFNIKDFGLMWWKWLLAIGRGLKRLLEWVLKIIK
ncbi:MAG: hypothetical protein PHQ86_08790 [Dehalococcoidales bacterium]|nr:hypothetical protein [Dehalococcoidales bacterium]